MRGIAVNPSPPHDVWSLIVTEGAQTYCEGLLGTSGRVHCLAKLAPRGCSPLKPLVDTDSEGCGQDEGVLSGLLSMWHARDSRRDWQTKCNIALEAAEAKTRMSEVFRKLCRMNSRQLYLKFCSTSRRLRRGKVVHHQHCGQWGQGAADLD